MTYTSTPRVAVGENYSGGGQLEYLESTGSSWGVYTWSTRSIYAFNTLDTPSTPSIAGVRTASTACTRGSVLLVLSICSQYLGLRYCPILPELAVFKPPVPQYSQCLKYEMYSILPSILGV